MGWLVAAAVAALWWYRTRGVSSTSSPLVADPTAVGQAQALLRAWMNTQGYGTLPAYTGDPSPALPAGGQGQPNGNAADPVFRGALVRFQSWAANQAIEFQDRPGAAAHYLRQDGQLDRATLGVLSAMTLPPSPAPVGGPVRVPLAMHSTAVRA